MTARAILETVVGLLITAVFAFVGAGVINLEYGWQSAFLVEGPNQIIVGFSVGGILWAILLLIGNIANRKRGGGWKFLTNTVSLLIAAVVNLAVWSVIGFSEGGWSIFLVVFAIAASAVVLVAGVLAMLVTHFAIFRRATPATEGSLT